MRGTPERMLVYTSCNRCGKVIRDEPEPPKVATLPRKIAESWASFESHVIPADAGPVQRRALREAFYGGASVVFWALVHAMAHEPDSVATLEALRAEIDEFVKAPLAAARAAAAEEKARRGQG